MKRGLLLLLMLSVTSTQAVAQNARASSRKKRATGSPADVAGTYKDVSSTFEIAEAADHQVSIDFTGFWPNIRPSQMKKYGVETLNVGGFQQTVPLRNGIAIVRLEFTDAPCVITIRFLRNRLKVTQEGASNDCGFGFNVEANGAYRKMRRGASARY
jgi:hypothetical protein